MMDPCDQPLLEAAGGTWREGAAVQAAVQEGQQLEAEVALGGAAGSRVSHHGSHQLGYGGHIVVQSVGVDEGERRVQRMFA